MPNSRSSRSSTRSACSPVARGSWPSVAGPASSTLLRGLKEHTSNLTAVVTVADDGGSSGVLREELGIPAVGDIRNCIVALADSEPLMNELLQYRFPVGDPTGRHGPRRASGRQPAPRGDDRDRGRRLRGGRPPAQPDPGRARPGRAGHGAPRSPCTRGCRDGTVVDGQSRIMRTPGHRARLGDARTT